MSAEFDLTDYISGILETEWDAKIPSRDIPVPHFLISGKGEAVNNHNWILTETQLINEQNLAQTVAGQGIYNSFYDIYIVWYCLKNTTQSAEDVFNLYWSEISRIIRKNKLKLYDTKVTELKKFPRKPVKTRDLRNRAIMGALNCELIVYFNTYEVDLT